MPVGHYNPDRAVVFHEGSDIKHIYFVAETKGYDKDSLKDYRRAESVKIECASRHFATISDSHVTYDVVKNYDELWDIIKSMGDYPYFRMFPDLYSFKLAFSNSFLSLK